MIAVCASLGVPAAYADCFDVCIILRVPEDALPSGRLVDSFSPPLHNRVAI